MEKMDDGKNFWRQEGGGCQFFLDASWEIKFFTDIIDKPLIS